jgi:hypothetical protein
MDPNFSVRDAQKIYAAADMDAYHLDTARMSARMVQNEIRAAAAARKLSVIADVIHPYGRSEGPRQLLRTNVAKLLRDQNFEVVLLGSFGLRITWPAPTEETPATVPAAVPAAVVIKKEAVPVVVVVKKEPADLI